MYKVYATVALHGIYFAIKWLMFEKGLWILLRSMQKWWSVCEKQFDKITLVLQFKLPYSNGLISLCNTSSYWVTTF